LAFVVGLTVGLNLVLYLLATAHFGFRPTIRFTEPSLVGTVVWEVVLACLLGRFLYLRGWRVSDFPHSVSLASTGLGVALWLGTYLLYAFSYSIVCVTLGPGDPLSAVSVHGHVGLPVAFLVTAINPLFEELLLVGYLLRALRGHGAAFAIGASVLLRLLPHSYQGPLAVVSIVPMGVLFGLYFWRFQNLWPPVFAHALADFIGLLSLVQ
jgi:membrane protease YdiL (CAAX protease family)